jgi:hypothetical protein
MPRYTPEGKASLIFEKMSCLTFTLEHLQLIGAFIVAYGLFETGLEPSLLALTGKNVRGMGAKDQFKLLGAGHSSFSKKANAVLCVAGQAAVDICEYRNSLVHGYLMAMPGGVPAFMKNPAWNPAIVKKGKDVGDAYADIPQLHLALDAAWTLSTLVRRAQKAVADAEAQAGIEALEADVHNARSCARELRHLRSLANHEKY